VDEPLTREAVTAAIESCFPAIECRGLEYLGSGWEFHAYLTSDGWVFRFPRTARDAELFEPERRVHELVSLVLPTAIALPRVELVGEPATGFPHRIAGHRFIRGIPADAVAADLLPTLGREIGVALGAIHSISERKARAAGIGEMDGSDAGRQEWLDRRRALASNLREIDPVIEKAVEWIDSVPVRIAPYAGPLRFIHHDLSPEHLIVDGATGRLTGILDWTDAILGDAARDFVFLVTWRGWDFAKDVLRNYPHAVDREFPTRLRFMARLLSVVWLAEAHEQGENLATHIAGVHNAFVAASVA
jgi:aminoglycoside phosphotransferase (APT) family kinase protein